MPDQVSGFKSPIDIALSGVESSPHNFNHPVLEFGEYKG